MNTLAGTQQSEPSNIKSRYNKRTLPTGLRPYFSGLKSPVPATIKDAKEYERFFKDYKDVFIPYSGTAEYTSHTLLGLLLSLKELSPTTSGVLLAKKRFALAGRVDVVRNEDETFDLGEVEPATDQEKRSFFEFHQLTQWRDVAGMPTTPRDFAGWVSDDLDTCGNAYIEVTLSDTIGERSATFDLLRPSDCLYVVTEPGQDKVIGVSPIWNKEYIERKPPRMLPVYPAFGEENGVRKTIVHVKSGNYAWYGRPQALSALNYQYFEWQNSDYLNKAAYSQFAGQALIEVEDPEPAPGDPLDDDTGFDNFVEKAESRLTNKADDLQRLLFSSRPYGARPAFVFQFTPNTNENWYQATNAEAERQILKAHGFPQRLVGMEANSGLSSNVFLDVMQTFSPTLFRELQQRVEQPINLCYRLAGEWLGRTEGEELGVRFTSPYREMIREQQEQQEQNNGTSNSE